MPKLSIIIPVYNASKTIVKCVDSLLRQTFADMEVIIVDDCGQDDSIKIIQNHIENHSQKNRFRFAQTPVNSGPGAARNVGLKMAQGEYVAFVDSDDWVEADIYETLYETATQHSADLCYCNVFWEDLNRKKQRVLPNTPIVNKRDFLANFKCQFWSYIYRREFLDKFNITFSKEKGVEDNYFLACCILCAERIAYVDKPMYHYTFYPNSLSNNRDEKRYLDKLSVFSQLFDFSKTHHFYDEYKQELQFIYLKKVFLVSTLNYLTNAKCPQVKTIREIYQEFTKFCPDYKKNPLYKKHFSLRMAVVFFHKMPRMACLILPVWLKLRERPFQ
ncbi:MAG: glycosyltransferase [Bacteroidales bacterium]|nr:glycosyltransferase [Bacteroidales bacterium]